MKRRTSSSCKHSRCWVYSRWKCCCVAAEGKNCFNKTLRVKSTSLLRYDISVSEPAAELQLLPSVKTCLWTEEIERQIDSSAASLKGTFWFVCQQVTFSIYLTDLKNRGKHAPGLRATHKLLKGHVIQLFKRSPSLWCYQLLPAEKRKKKKERGPQRWWQCHDRCTSDGAGFNVPLFVFRLTRKHLVCLHVVKKILYGGKPLD